MKNTENDKLNYKSKTLIFFMYLYCFYYSYRYLLKYNAESEAAGYVDTPIVFKVTKYILLIIAIIYLFINNGPRISFSSHNKTLMYIVLYMSFVSLIYGLITINFDLIEFFLILFPLIFFLNSGERINICSIEKVLDRFWVFSVLYEIFQIIQYVLYTRIPALAHATGKITDLRFGSTWDDPNGFAMVCIFYFFYHLMKSKKEIRLFFIGIDLIMLLLTWSGTGFISFILVLISMVFLRINDKQMIKRMIKIFLVILCVGIVFCLINLPYIIETLNYMVMAKGGSIEGHFIGWKELFELPLPTLLGLYPLDAGGEIGYIHFISTGGFQMLLIYLFFDLVLVKRSCIAIKFSNNMQVAILYGCLAYLLAFSFGLLNFQHQYSFSAFGLYVVFAILVLEIFEKVRSS